MNRTEDSNKPELKIIDIRVEQESESDFDLKTSDLDILSRSQTSNFRIYSNLSLSFSSMQLIYENFFQVNLNESSENNKSLLFLRRRKTFRSIGMDMVKR